MAPHVAAIVLGAAAAAGVVIAFKHLVWDPHLKAWIEAHQLKRLEQPHSRNRRRSEAKFEEEKGYSSSWNVHHVQELRQRHRPAPSTSAAHDTGPGIALHQMPLAPRKPSQDTRSASNSSRAPSPTLSRINTFYSVSDVGEDDRSTAFDVRSAPSEPGTPLQHPTNPELLSSFADSFHLGTPLQADDGLSMSSFTVRSDDSDVPDSSRPLSRASSTQSGTSGGMSEAELVEYSGSDTSGQLVELSSDDDSEADDLYRPRLRANPFISA